MTLTNALALFGALVVLAALPSMSVFLVATRSATLGLRHGLCTTLGIILGDLVFILIAVWGLGQLANTLGGLFTVIKYLGGGYLIFLGVGLWRTQPREIQAIATETASLWGSLLSGLSVTLGDQKATLFYLGFLPAFMDMGKIAVTDVILLVLLMVAAVGSVKITYAVLAERAKFLLQPRIRHSLNRIAGVILITVGLVLILKP